MNRIVNDSDLPLTTPITWISVSGYWMGYVPYWFEQVNRTGGFGIFNASHWKCRYLFKWIELNVEIDKFPRLRQGIWFGSQIRSQTYLMRNCITHLSYSFKITRVRYCAWMNLRLENYLIRCQGYRVVVVGCQHIIQVYFVLAIYGEVPLRRMGRGSLMNTFATISIL